MPAHTWQHGFLEKAGFLSSPDFEASPHEEFVVRGSSSSAQPVTVTRTRFLVEADAPSANELTMRLVIGTWVVTLGGDTRTAYSFHPGHRTSAYADVEHWRTCGGFAGASESCPRCDGHVFSGKKLKDWSPYKVRRRVKAGSSTCCCLHSLARRVQVKVEPPPQGPSNASGSAQQPLQVRRRRGGSRADESRPAIVRPQSSVLRSPRRWLLPVPAKAQRPTAC